jgi:hypothetical protein
VFGDLWGRPAVKVRRSENWQVSSAAAAWSDNGPTCAYVAGAGDGNRTRTVSLGIGAESRLRGAER